MGTAIFTAIDGTLLDSKTFDAGAANRAALQRLHAANIPVIPVTVMTLEEIMPIAADLRLRHAMIIEAGGAIARRRKGRWEVEPCGPPAEIFLDAIRDIEDRSGANLLVYSAMEESAAAKVSGRSGPMLQASTKRCFSEPFVIESGDLESIAKAAAAIGFSIRRGPRFLYLCPACDQGQAFTRLRQELQCEFAIGVGGSLLDAEFLMRADIAIVVPRADGTIDPELLETLPSARIAPAPAPDGWAVVVEAVLGERARRSHQAAYSSVLPR